MRLTVEFSTRTARSKYEIPDVKKTEETTHCLVVTTKDGEVLRFPWSSIAWTRTETRP